MEALPPPTLPSADLGGVACILMRGLVVVPAARDQTRIKMRTAGSLTRYARSSSRRCPQIMI